MQEDSSDQAGLGLTGDDSVVIVAAQDLGPEAMQESECVECGLWNALKVDQTETTVC